MTESARREERKHSFQIGDLVLVKDRNPGNKFRTPFEKEPWTVTHIKGTKIAGKTATRNSDQKRVLV